MFQVNYFFLWDWGLILYLLSHFISIYIFFITGLSDKRLIPINKKNNTHWILPTAVYQINFLLLLLSKKELYLILAQYLENWLFFFSFPNWKSLAMLSEEDNGLSQTKLVLAFLFFFAVALCYWPLLDLHSKIFLYFLPKQDFPTNLEI